MLPIPDPPSSPPSRRQCPRTPRAGRAPSQPLRPRRPSAGPRRPSGPHLIRRCGRGAGTDSSTTTGRSASGRGSSGPLAVCAGRAPAALRASRARALGRRLPGRLSRGPGLARLGHRLPAARARGGAGVDRAARRAATLRQRRGRGRLTPGRGEAGGEGGRRKRTEGLHRKGAAYSRLSLPRAKATGLELPPVPANLPPLLHPRPGHGPLQIGGRRVLRSYPAGRPQMSEPGRQELGCKVKVNNTIFMGGVGWGWDPGGGPGVARNADTHLSALWRNRKAQTQLKDAKLPNCSTKRRWTCW